MRDLPDHMQADAAQTWLTNGCRRHETSVSIDGGTGCAPLAKPAKLDLPANDSP